MAAPRWLAIACTGLLLSAVPGTSRARTPEPPRAAFRGGLPWLREAGMIEGIFRAGFRSDDPGPFGSFFHGDRDRDRTSYQLAIAAVLAERVEVSIQGGAVRTSGDGGTGGFSASDLELSFGYGLRESTDSPFAAAARFLAKVPTAPEEGEAGTDEADLGFELSWGYRRGPAGIFLRSGIELLGNPAVNGSQDDVMSFSAGGWVRASEGMDLLLEIDGRAFSRFENSGASVRAGGYWRFRRAAGRLQPALFATVSRGLAGSTPEKGFSMGLSLGKSR